MASEDLARVHLYLTNEEPRDYLYFLTLLDSLCEASYTVLERHVTLRFATEPHERTVKAQSCYQFDRNSEIHRLPDDPFTVQRYIVRSSDRTIVVVLHRGLDCKIEYAGDKVNRTGWYDFVREKGWPFGRNSQFRS